MKSPLVRMLVVLFGAGLLMALYVAAPLWAAHALRSAAKAGDVATLEAKIEWQSLRESLKASLRTAGRAEVPDAEGQARRSIWQRIKAAAAPAMTDRLVDRMVTPQGVAQLARSDDVMAAIARAAGIRQTAPARGPRSVAKAGTADAEGEFLSLVTRLQRIALYSPVHFEFEIADRRNPSRRYVSTMRLRGLEWKLTEVRVVGASFDL